MAELMEEQIEALYREYRNNKSYPRRFLPLFYVALTAERKIRILKKKLARKNNYSEENLRNEFRLQIRSIERGRVAILQLTEKLFKLATQPDAEEFKKLHKQFLKMKKQ